MVAIANTVGTIANTVGTIANAVGTIANAVGTIANTVGTSILAAGYLTKVSTVLSTDHVLRFGKYRRILVLC
jgi:hypothetical protein